MAVCLGKSQSYLYLRERMGQEKLGLFVVCVRLSQAGRWLRVQYSIIITGRESQAGCVFWEVATKDVCPRCGTFGSDIPGILPQFSGPKTLTQPGELIPLGRSQALIQLWDGNWCTASSSQDEPPTVLSLCVMLLLLSELKYCTEMQVYCYQSHLMKLDKCILMQIIKR